MASSLLITQPPRAARAAAPVRSVSPAEVAQLLSSLNHATPVTFSALTVADTLPNSPEILKLSSVSAFTGCHYEGSVNRQLLREGKGQLSFTAAARKWGTRTRPALVEHKGAAYLPAHVLGARTVYLVRAEDGTLRITTKDLIAKYLRKVESPRNQGVDKPIIYRDYSLANLVSLSFNRQRLRITRAATVAATLVPSARPKAPRAPRRLTDCPCDYPEGWDEHKGEY